MTGGAGGRWKASRGIRGKYLMTHGATDIMLGGIAFQPGEVIVAGVRAGAHLVVAVGAGHPFQVLVMEKTQGNALLRKDHLRRRKLAGGKGNRIFRVRGRSVFRGRNTADRSDEDEAHEYETRQPNIDAGASKTAWEAHGITSKLAAEVNGQLRQEAELVSGEIVD